MSMKTIAVNTRVYQRLSGIKREGESFSRTIDRLLEEVSNAHTGRDVLSGLETIDPLNEDEAVLMLRVIDEDRELEAWPLNDLR